MKKAKLNTWLEKASKDSSTIQASFHEKAGQLGVLSVKVKTKITTLAKSGEFSREELLVKSHDLINSDAVDIGTK